MAYTFFTRASHKTQTSAHITHRAVQFYDHPLDGLASQSDERSGWKATADRPLYTDVPDGHPGGHHRRSRVQRN